jgi:hypothetical protein
MTAALHVGARYVCRRTVFREVSRKTFVGARRMNACLFSAIRAVALYKQASSCYGLCSRTLILIGNVVVRAGVVANPAEDGQLPWGSWTWHACHEHVDIKNVDGD